MGTPARLSLLLSGTALAAVLLSSVVEIDERAFEHRALADTPIHLLSDSSLLDVWRSVGYRTATESFDNEWDRFYEHIEHAPPANYAWVLRETERKVRLLDEIGGNGVRTRFFRFLTEDRARAVSFARRRPRFERCRRAIYEGDGTSPELLRELRANAREADRIGARGWTGWLWETIADCHFNAGRPDSGLAALRTALECHLLVENYSSLAHVSTRIGYEMTGRGRFAEADSIYRTSLAYAGRVGDPFLISRVHAFTGALRTREGFHVEAESLYALSIDACRRTEYPLCEAARRLSLARLYADLGEYSRARRNAARVVFTLDSLLCPDITLDTAVRHSCQNYLAAAHGILGRTLAREGRHEEAAAAFERAAVSGGIDTARRAEALRRLAGTRLAAGDVAGARRRIAEALSVARGTGRRGDLADCLVTHGEIEIEAGEPGKAASILDRARRIALEEGRPRAAGGAEHRLGCLAAAGGDLAEARDRFLSAIDLVGEESGNDGRVVHGDRLRRIGADLLDVEARLGDADSFLVRAACLRCAPDAIDAGERRLIERLVADRRWIPAGVTMLEYCTTPGDCFVVVAGSERLLLERIPASADALESLVDALVEASTEMAPARDACRLLSGLLLDPVARAIEGDSVICILRDGPLRRLPFGALHAPGRPGERLVERCDIRYAPDLVAAAREAKRTVSERPLLVGEPLVDPYARRLYPHLRAIPGARLEIASVRGRLGHATILVGAAATRTAVVDRLAGADLFHVAAHTLRWPVYDGRAALLFASPSGMRRERDLRGALLTPGDIAALDLGGLSLVVLSACESSRAAAGDHAERGLPEAFVEAGAGAVISSLWPVEDKSARRLVDAFYEELLRGRSPSAALADARRGVLWEARNAGREAESLIEWAPFVVTAPIAASADDRAARIPLR